MNFKVFFISLVVFLLVELPCLAQSCYQQNRNYGISCYNNQEYDKAIKYFEAAAMCPDKPKSNDLNGQISKCKQAKQQAAENERRQREQQAAEDERRRRESTYLRVDNKTLVNTSFSSSGGSEVFSVSTNATSWSTWGVPNWITVTNKTSSSFKLVCSANSGSTSRSDYMKIMAGGKEVRINITQAASESPYLTTSRSQLSFPYSGGSESITVSSNKNWSIKYSPNQWGHLTRNGNTLTLRVDANTSNSQRTDYFTLTAGGIDKRINITQAGIPGPTATINNVWVDYDVFFGMNKGMRVHVNFIVNGMNGKKVRNCIFFYLADNNKTKLYNMSGNQVSTYEVGTANYDNCQWKDWSIFIPYTTLKPYPTLIGVLNLLFDVEIQDLNGKLLASRRNIQFTIRY